MVVLQSFLGCHKLRTGCLFIGYSGAVYTMLVLIISAICIVATAMGEHLLKGDDKIKNKFIMGIAIYIFIMSAVNFALHVVLLVGVYQKRPRLINVYLVVMIIFLVIACIAALVVTWFDIRRGLTYIITFAINIYYLLVIKSHRMEIENSKQSQPHELDKV